MEKETRYDLACIFNEAQSLAMDTNSRKLIEVGSGEGPTTYFVSQPAVATTDGRGYVRMYTGEWVELS